MVLFVWVVVSVSLQVIPLPDRERAPARQMMLWGDWVVSRGFGVFLPEKYWLAQHLSELVF